MHLRSRATHPKLKKGHGPQEMGYQVPDAAQHAHGVQPHHNIILLKKKNKLKK